jgi:hypothetical protein
MLSVFHPSAAGFHVSCLVLWTQLYSMPEQQKIIPVVAVVIVMKLYVSYSSCISLTQLTVSTLHDCVTAPMGKYCR